MTTHEEALKLAREGVEIHSPNSPEYIVCAALIEALAQPEQEPLNYTVNVKCGRCGSAETYDLTIDATPPQRKPLTDEQMQFLATAIGQAQQIIDTHNAEFVTARDDLRRCAELLAAHGIKE